MSEVLILLVLVLWASGKTLDPHFLREPFRMQVHRNDWKSYDYEILHLLVGSYSDPAGSRYYPIPGWYLLRLLWRWYVVQMDVLRVSLKQLLLMYL